MWYVRPAKAQICASDQSLCSSLKYSMDVKLLTEHHLEFLSLKGGCTGSYESTLVKMPDCWKSHATALIISIIDLSLKGWPKCYHDNMAYIEVCIPQEAVNEFIIT